VEILEPENYETLAKFCQLKIKHWLQDKGGRLRFTSQKGGNPTIRNKGCVTLWPLPFTLKSILRQKKTCQKIKIFHHAKI
jgi:hypothetical protein